jgi:hypothetical protein
MTPVARTSTVVLFATWLGAVSLVTLRADQGAVRIEQPRPSAIAPPAGDSLFTPSKNCLACHNNLVSSSGEDVSIGAQWRGSIMANASRDPYFHASLRRETIDHPTAAAEIQDECASCHLPAAKRMADARATHTDAFGVIASLRHSGGDDEANVSSDGVTCTICHQIAPDGLGTAATFNGNFALAAPLATGSRRANGPYAPDPGRVHLMHSVTGFEQTQAPHIRQSELCASCHTLITQALGPDGKVIGSLPEQMNYQEWRHSAFDEEGRSCQSCHMPPVQGPIKISSVVGLDRESLARHTFLGGNAFMLRLMNRYRAELGVEATPGELEATALATVRQLETNTATVSLDRVEITGPTLVADVVVTNLTGHKFPTGYPSRRAWLHLTVRNADGSVAFESGRLADTGRIDDNDADANANTFEAHYREITRPGEVQVYESVMGTPAGAPTTGLLQATQYLKDNRLLPRGFDKQTAPADIGVFGQAAQDDDFAAGGDRVRYRVPLVTPGRVLVEVELRYQPIGYRWAQNLASYKASEPEAFVRYFNALAPSSSVVVGRAQRAVGP